MPSPPTPPGIPSFSTLHALQIGAENRLESLIGAKQVMVAGRLYYISRSGKAREQQEDRQRVMHHYHHLRDSEVRGREHDVAAILRRARNEWVIRDSIRAAEAEATRAALARISLGEGAFEASGAGADAGAGAPKPFEIPRPSTVRFSGFPTVAPSPMESPSAAKLPKRVHFSEQVEKKYFHVTDAERACQAVIKAEVYAAEALEAAESAAEEVDYATKLTDAIYQAEAIEAAKGGASERAKELADIARKATAALTVAKAAAAQAKQAARRCQRLVLEAEESCRRAVESSDQQEAHKAADKTEAKMRKVEVVKNQATEFEADAEQAAEQVGQLAVVAGIARPDGD